MPPSRTEQDKGVRYEPDEKPPFLLTAALGLQLAVFVLVGIVIVPTIVFRAARLGEGLLAWAVFVSLIVCGSITILQAMRFKRFGGGQIIVTGVSGTPIAVSTAALTQGGPAMLACLVAASSLLQFLLSGRLAFFRQILTPTVTGTLIMLIPVTVMPIIFGMFQDTPPGASDVAAPLITLITVAAICGISLKVSGALRLWSPMIGMAIGCLAAGLFGFVNLDGIAAASWIDFPTAALPGLNFDFGPAFWALLPGFVFISLVSSIQTISGSVAIQRASWRKSRAVDFRSVQNAVAIGGLGNMLSGLGGTVSNSTYLIGASMTEMTGVASRRVGVALGGWLLALAFLPKVFALLLAIPPQVIAAYIAVMMAMLFMVGLKLVLQDGIDYRKGIIVGVSFWAGVGFHSGLIFPELTSEVLGGLLQHGMTAGGFIALIMSLFVEVSRPRARRLETTLDLSALPQTREFLGRFADRYGWNEAMRNRLDLVSEEAMMAFMRPDEDAGSHRPRKLILTVRKDRNAAVIEFYASSGEENLQDRIALLGEQIEESSIEREVSLRLLRHLSSSVRHQQYHDTDIVTVRVEVPESAGASED